VPIDMPEGRGALVVFADIGDRLRAEHVVGERDGVPGSREDSVRRIAALAHGILPTILTRGGLLAAVGAIVTRLHVPTDVDIPDERFPAEIEASAYFIVAEALTNIVKHADATRAKVRTSTKHGMLRVEVRDDGIGGADPSSHGLVGMSDRVAALGGRLEFETLPGAGTTVVATLPISRGSAD
jgi:signal transduction histidine kinase